MEEMSKGIRIALNLDPIDADTLQARLSEILGGDSVS